MTLSELYTLRKLEYHRTVPGAPTPVQFAPSGTSKPVGRSSSPLVELDPPVATVLPKATGISWPFASRVKYIPSRPGLVRSIKGNYPLTLIVQEKCLPRGRGQLDPTHHVLGQLQPFGPLPRGPLGVEHGQLR